MFVLPSLHSRNRGAIADEGKSRAKTFGGPMGKGSAGLEDVDSCGAAFRHPCQGLDRFWGDVPRSSLRFTPGYNPSRLRRWRRFVGLTGRSSRAA